MTKTIIQDIEKQQQPPSSATELTPLTPLTPVCTTPKKKYKCTTSSSFYTCLKWTSLIVSSLIICTFAMLLFQDDDAVAGTVERGGVEMLDQGDPFLVNANDNNDDIMVPISENDMEGIIEDQEEIASIPLQRRDVVENNTPEQLSISLTAPPLFLSHHTILSQPDTKNKKNIRQHQSNNQQSKNSSASKLRWGILGPGRIAHDFTSTLIVSGCTITAVAASHQDYYDNNHIARGAVSPPTDPLSRAKAFANKFSIPNYYGSYQELAQDPNVDIVYVATTNQEHMEPTMLMLQSNKNVLVEKPTTVRYEDARIMYEEAKKRGLFLMTNHWTRFFPLVRYLRHNFLTPSSPSYTDDSDGTIDGRDTTSTSTTAREMFDETSKHQKQQMIRNDYNYKLGKVLAMHGDFSFATPLSPSDRFLNRTLGGGVTLDVGCYLVELALLAAYDYRESRRQNNYSMQKGMDKDVPIASLNPDGVMATGHGMYNGQEFPVDVESSFSLRWGGGKYGIWDGDCESSSRSIEWTRQYCGSASINGGRNLEPDTRRDRVVDNSMEDFTMVASFQASFRRPSSFEVEYVFEHGRIVIHGPGNCPNQMTIFEHEPFGPLVRETKVTYPLPSTKEDILQYGHPNYPRAEGFVYVIDAIEKCMSEKGVPGSSNLKGTAEGGGCLELEENTIEEQLVTVEVTEEVLKEMGYFGSDGIGHRSF